MDSLHLCIAVSPVALYLLWLGFINFRGRPLVVSGFKDNLFLALAISGFAIVGPLELFLPESAAFRFGPKVWLLLFTLYALVTALVILSMRPRIVVYNLSGEELRPLVVSAARKVDPQSRWAGETVDMPGADVHLHLDRLSTMRNVQLIASGPQQDFGSWTELEKELESSLKDVTTSRNPHGVTFLLLAAMLISFVVLASLTDQQAMAQSLQEMLRI